MKYGTLEKILKAFEGEDIHLDPALQSHVALPVIATPILYRGKQSLNNFEDLKRELLSRRYSVNIRITSDITPNWNAIRTVLDRNKLAERQRKFIWEG